MIKKVARKILKAFMSPASWARYIGVEIGENNLIGKDHWSSEPYLISVGSNCQLTNCKIFTHGGAQVIRDKYPDFDTFGRVKIGNWVYIGAGSLIMPGVIIEDHVLVAAGSVVTKSIPAYSIVAGNPAKIIGSTTDYFERNKKYNVKTKGLTPKEKEIKLKGLNPKLLITKDYLDASRL